MHEGDEDAYARDVAMMDARRDWFTREARRGLVYERSPQEIIRGGRRPVRKIALNKRSVDEQKLGSTSG